jgi:hypothetical protein
MAHRARSLFLASFLLLVLRPALAADARFDLVGPRIDVRVTRTAADGAVQTLPIAAVPNLQVGDKLWIHPDFPPSQSVKYLLICVFLRGTTNPPPENWFFRIETWNQKVREEGAFITVPAEAEQALLFMAPETGGDFSTLRSAVQGRPGAFVRAQQDLTEAGFEQARIEKYLASIRRVPPSDSAELQKHSDLLARTLALKPNTDCFKRPVDTQFTCLTQSGSQIVLDDGHGQNIVSALSNGPGSDLINQASYTQALGAGVYSAYVGAIVDLVRILGNLHTAQYQYIPAISFPQAEQMNLRLNTPPSFHNPKSVLVIALPSVQAATPPPLRPADPRHVACLLEPTVVLPIEGAPLVFSTDFAHNLVLHPNTPPGAPSEPDIPLIPDAYSGGLVLQQTPQHHIPLHDPLQSPTDMSSRPKAAGRSGETPVLSAASAAGTSAPFSAKLGHPDPGSLGLQPKVSSGLITSQKDEGALAPQPEPVTLTGTIRGRWGFDTFTGPTLPLQQLPGSGWHIVTPDASLAAAATPNLIAGHNTQLLLASTGAACVHTITAEPGGARPVINISFKLEPLPSATPPADPASTQPATPNPAEALKQVLALTLPLEHELTPGDLHLAIQQYDQPRPDELSTRTFAEPPVLASVELHAGDRDLLLKGSHLEEIDRLTLGDLTFSTAADTSPSGTLRLELPPTIPTPSTHPGEHLSATVVLHDGRTLTLPVTISTARPVITLLRKSIAPAAPDAITLSNDDDVPLTSQLVFTLKSPTPFPRTGQIEIETLDGTLRTVLTLAPSGGLVLQDPHTVVATLDPQRSFGPSAFGALHLRAVFPAASAKEGTSRPSNDFPSRPESAHSAASDTTTPASDWLPLATLVRLPTFTQLQCAPDPTQPCTLTGANLFLLQSVSTDPAFANPIPVPDGYTGSTLSLPHPTANTLFLRLRDDPAPIDSAIFPAPPVSTAPAGHRATKAAATAPTHPAPPTSTPTPTAPVPPAAASTSPGPSR